MQVGRAFREGVCLREWLLRRASFWVSNEACGFKRSRLSRGLASPVPPKPEAEGEKADYMVRRSLHALRREAEGLTSFTSCMD